MSDDKSHSMMIMWLDLTTALGAVRRRPNPGEKSLLPWSSSDPNVKRVWKKITAPENLDELEQWLVTTSRQQKRAWIAKAIEQCKRRSKRKV
jgi:hypothetical protein